MNRNLYLWAGCVSIAAGMAGLFYFFRRESHLSKRVAAKLPVAKPLKTVSDSYGNYDIDGVSYDTSGVVISGDAQSAPSPV